LIDNNLGNFVRNLYMSLEDVTFFSCSSLGRMPNEVNHTAFVPHGVLDPLSWLLGETKVFSSLKERKIYIDQEHKKISNAQSNYWQKLRYYYWDSLLPKQEIV
jgi:hypothetical protein